MIEFLSGILFCKDCTTEVIHNKVKLYSKNFNLLIKIIARPSSRRKLKGVKIRFYESKGGGNTINICMCKAVSTQHLGSRSMPPEEFF